MRIVLAVAVLALLGACASGGTSGTEPSPSPSPQSRLTVTVHDGATTHRWTLTCDPPGGDHPAPQRACATLDRLGAKAFAPVPPGTMCTQIYGGAQTATIVGTWRGRRVDASYSRTDGCQIARWDRIVDVLQVRGGVATS